ncbi:hypothetical protein HOB85_06060, partial [Candidatus Woesearchaeota archaeon]|nr:hypothetical protein [Candidatus Woesearchaeota archaeon]
MGLFERFLAYFDSDEDLSSDESDDEPEDEIEDDYDDEPEDKIKEVSDSIILEYRYSGYPRKYIKDRYDDLQRSYGLGHPKYHYVPHITIAGPMIASNERKLIKELEKVIFKNAPLFHEPGNLIGSGKYITFPTQTGGRVLAFAVRPPQSLIDLKREIETHLNSVKGIKCRLYRDEIWHTTLLIIKDIHKLQDKFSKIWKELKDSPQEMRFILDRISLIKNRQILKEFDLVTQKTHSRLKALDNSKRCTSYLELKKELESKGEIFHDSGGGKLSTLKPSEIEEKLSKYTSEVCQY